MGFLVSFSRKMTLTSYINQLEVKLNDITTQKLNLTDSIAQLTTQINDFGKTDSPAVKQLEARKVALENLEKQFDSNKTVSELSKDTMNAEKFITLELTSEEAENLEEKIEVSVVEPDVMVQGSAYRIEGKKVKKIKSRKANKEMEWNL